MCRLAYLPHTAFSLPWLPAFLNEMEKDNGGHGMGIACGKKKAMLKGVLLDIKDCLTFAKLRRGWPAIWHTRWVSCGSKSDELCHPFPCAGGYLVHNGHWTNGAIAANLMDDICGQEFSDTKMFALLANKLGFWDAARKYTPDGIWLYLKRGVLEVYAGSGDLFHDPVTNILASQPADCQTGWKRVKTGFVYRGLSCFEYDDRPWRGKFSYPRFVDKKAEKAEERAPETDTSETLAAEMELYWNDKDQVAEGAWSKAGE